MKKLLLLALGALFVPALASAQSALNGTWKIDMNKVDFPKKPDVFVLQNGKVEERTVKLGAQSPQGQIVLSGIDPGAKLAIAVSGKLSDGAKVRIEEP